ncbi:MAG: anaerobic ribonucleoside-triphosphate reductase activating protein [Dictyoglomi bacterium]|nr:anaerobic ribonucleoside-triphosphate reductase activating protein [Dictyoglomota bacterium]
MLIGGLHKLSLIDYPGKLSAVIFTRGCNFRCPYCHNPELIESNGGDFIEEDKILSFLDERKGKLDGVVVTGGEPTLQSEIVEFLERIKRLGFFVKLDTNGSYPERIKELIDRKLLDYIAMDIKAPLYKYNRTTLTSIDTERIVESIHLIMNSGIDYEFRTTVVRSLLSRDDFPKIGEMIKSAKLFVLQEFRPTKTLDPDFLKETSYTKRELEEISISLKELVSKVIIR